MDIKFSTNWNNKLGTICFTTIRPFCAPKYQIGMTYNIILRDKIVKQATCIDIKHFKLIEITSFMSYLDANLSPKKFCELMYKFYSSKHDIEKMTFSFILLKTI